MSTFTQDWKRTDQTLGLEELDRLLDPSSPAGELALLPTCQPPERIQLSLPYSRKLAQLYKQAEREVEREIEAAQLLDGVQSRPPRTGLVLRRRGGHSRYTQEEVDQWWMAVYGVREEEMVELTNRAARYYLSTRWPGRRKHRAEALNDYVRLDSRLTKASGLSTGWD